MQAASLGVSLLLTEDREQTIYEALFKDTEEL